MLEQWLEMSGSEGALNDESQEIIEQLHVSSRKNRKLACSLIMRVRSLRDLLILMSMAGSE